MTEAGIRPTSPAWWQLLLVGLAAVVPLLPSLSAPFVYDDHALIEPLFHEGGPGLGEALGSHLFGSEDAPSGYYRPFVTLTYHAEAALYGNRPALFHGSNLLVHLACSLLLLLVVTQLGVPSMAALAVAVLFAAHPVHAESLVPVSGRTDALAMLFLLLGTWAARRGATPGAIVGFVLALLCKESAAAYLPALCLVAAAGGSRASLRRAGLLLAAGLVAMGAFLTLRAALGIHIPEQAHTGLGTPVERWLTTLPALARYATLLLWPAELSITHMVHLVQDPTDPRFHAGLALLLLCGVLLIASRDAVLRGGILVFLLGLLPIGSAVKVAFAIREMPFPFFERFLYIPSAGFLLALVLLLVRALRRAPGPWTPRVLLGLTLVGGTALGTRLWYRCQDFRDDVTLFLAAARDFPQPEVLLAYAGNSALMQGDFERADLLFQTALEHNRWHADSATGRALVLVFQAQSLRKELDSLRLAAQPGPAAEIRQSLQTVLGHAEATLRPILEHNPDQPAALEVMAMLRALQDQPEEAVRWIQRAIAVGSTSPSLRTNRALIDQLLLAHFRRDPDPALIAKRTAAFVENLLGSFPPARCPPELFDTLQKSLLVHVQALVAMDQRQQARVVVQQFIAMAPSRELALELQELLREL